jgi:hypothetical protein
MSNPTVISVPLITVQPSSPLIGGTNSTALSAYISGNSAKNNNVNHTKTGSNILRTTSSSKQYSTAVSNYLKADAEYQNRRAAVQGAILAASIASQIAANYDYVGVSDTGQLGILADPSLTLGGNLIADATPTGNINYYNDAVTKTDVYVNYGTVQYPTAAAPNQVTRTQVGDDGLPQVSSINANLSPQQLVAETSFQKKAIYAPAPKVINSQPITASTAISAAQGAIPNATSPTATAVVDKATQAEIANQAIRSTGYLEDAAGTNNSITANNASTINQAASAAKSTAAGNNNLPINNLISPSPATPLYTSQYTPVQANGGVVPNATPASSGPKGNPLHDYATYTYKISVYAIPKETANTAASGGISPGNESSILQGAVLLMSSGGSQTSDKGQRFYEDFFIDNLKFSSIVGQTSRNRATDVIELSFDVIEPYNITLLPRLLATAQDLTGNTDWAMCFYVMKIQFIGYDVDGQPTIVPNIDKYIPFNFTACEFDIGVKGAVYHFKGIPSNHWAQTHVDNVIPFHMEITGGTVNEVFNGKTTPPAGPTNDRTDASPSGTAQGGTSPGKGIADALNSSEADFVKNKVKSIANQYAFRFEGGIGDKLVVSSQEYVSQGFRFSDSKNALEKLPNAIQLDKTSNTFKAQAGTKITDLVGAVLQMSDYMSGQYASPSPADKPLYTYKIVPEVKFLGYDNKLNMYARSTTYVIIPYVQYGYDAEGFGQKAPTTQQAVKQYKWMYTGQNKDIIDVKFSYKAAFFTVRNGGARAQLLQNDAPQPPPENTDANNDAAENPKSGMFPSRVQPTRGNADNSNTGARNVSKKTIAVEELFAKQFDSAGDNIQLDITIVGDPDLIQQDNVLYGMNGGASSGPTYSNGSVNFVNYETYFNFSFVTPMQDYNEQTGLFDITNESTEHFNGLYRIMQVTSEFRGGKFTQKLGNYRVKVQSNTDTTAARSSSGTTAGTANNTAAPVASAASTNSNAALGNGADAAPTPSTNTGTPSTVNTSTTPTTASQITGL